MFISVVIPTIGRETLNACLQSLGAQTYPRDLFEVIVVEDGVRSVEKSVNDFGFRYLSQEHRGPAAARNFGARSARGDVLAFTDDDCTVPSNWLEKLADGYRRHPDAVGVGGYMEAPEEVLAANPFAAYESYMTRQVYKAGDLPIFGGFEVPTGGTNNLSYKKEIFEKAGGFDEKFPGAAGEDADLKKRITGAGAKLLYIPLKVTHFHRYRLLSFIRQNRDRGLGSLYFQKKHGEQLGRVSLLRGIIISPLSFLSDCFVSNMNWRVAFLKTLAQKVNYLTQLLNYGKV
ncbi:MAG: glycosyltransferase [Patescibacteria group bacterium]